MLARLLLYSQHTTTTDLRITTTMSSAPASVQPFKAAPHVVATPQAPQVAARPTSKPQPLAEQYRPRHWSEVVGQDAALKRIALVGKRGLSGRAWFINGPSGVGKTTLARLIAADVGDQVNIDELDVKWLTPARLSAIEKQANNYRLGNKIGAAYIVNEAHGLNSEVIVQFLTMLDRLPSHVAWILTTTKEGQAKLLDEETDAASLTSRCVMLNLASNCLTLPFARRAKEIAEAEGLGGKPMEAYIQLVNAKQCNMRAVLNEIEAGAMLT